LTFNKGAAWGAFEGIPSYLFFFRVAFLGVLLAVYFTAQMRSVSRAALAVILAGAAGNIIDTVMWGHVVDMIHLQFWGWDHPVFNVADLAICKGAVTMLLVASFSSEKKSIS
jgi:signal peptidase II